MEKTGQRYCRKCLIRDTDQAEYFNNMYDYIRRMPEETKASPQEYERRLAVCRSCSRLQSGMCRICGCFVEMRAAVKVQICPDTPDRWQSAPEQTGETQVR